MGEPDTPIHHLARLFGRRLDQYATDLGPGSVRVLLIVATYALFAYMPAGLFAVVLWVVVIWLVPRGYRDRAEALQLHYENQRLREIAYTSADVIARLEHDLEVARTRSSMASGCGHPVYRRVGLDQNAPAWVVAAVRRAYRAKLHPDAHPASRKAEAERRFKLAESIFDQISKLRSFR